MVNSSEYYKWRRSILESQLPPLTRLLLLSMSDRMKDGSCHPSLNRLSQDTGMSKSSVARQLKVAESHQFITVKKDRSPTGSWSYNTYTARHLSSSEREALIEKLKSVSLVPEGDNLVPEGDYPSPTQTPTLVPVGVSNNHKENTQLTVEEKIEPPVGAVVSKRKGKAWRWGAEDDLRMSQYLFKKMRVLDKNLPKPDFAEWSDHIRLLRTADGRPVGEIKRVFDWANQDSFWQGQTTTPKQLRKHFNQILIKSNSQPSLNRGRSRSGVAL
jgi:hypothetical protein